jgi:hypothetical protein
MGVKGLTAFLKEKELIYNISLKDLKSKYNIKAIGIDFSLYLHKVCYRLDNTEDNYKHNRKDDIIDYFNSLYRRKIEFQYYKTFPKK